MKFKYAFEFNFNLETLTFCRALKEKYGAGLFCYEPRSWRFNDLQFVSIIRNRYPDTWIDENMHQDIEEFEIGKQLTQLRLKKAIELKSKVSSELEIPQLKGNLLPYQKVAVEFFDNNNGKAILADTMGLGKTFSALGYAVHSKKKKILVVCPASVKFVWEAEVEKWTKLKPLLMDSKTVLSPAVYSQHDIFIINYDILKRFALTLASLRFDLGIADEFHYIKNITAQRTKLSKAILAKIPSILLLSGTPFLSRPVELFNGLQLMDPLTWSNWRKFTERYCGGHQGYFGWDSSGATNIEELRERISPYFLRRTKEDVLKELPPKRKIHFPVELSAEIQKEYKLAEKDFINYLREVKKKREFDVQRAANAEKLVKLNYLREITTRGKVGIAEEIINNTIDGGEKIVVFSVFNAPLEELKEKFGDSAVLLTGKVDAKERKKLIEKFQNIDKYKIFLGGIKSAGVGITLTSASNVLFIDYSWNPADHEQATDRIHRIGQKADSINIYQLFALNTVDHRLKQILDKKQLLFDQLIDGKDPLQKKTSTSVMTDLLKFYEK